MFSASMVELRTKHVILMQWNILGKFHLDLDIYSIKLNKEWYVIIQLHDWIPILK